MKTEFDNTLRIGSLLQYYIGEEGCEWEETTIDWQDLKWLAEKPENFNKVHKGIPLTGEWLTKFGFESVDVDDTRGEYHKRVGEWGIFVIDVDGDGYTYPNSACTIVTKLEFVHQLQNLFLAVTYSELAVGSKSEDDFLNSKTLDTLNEETVTPHDANTMLCDSLQQDSEMLFHECPNCNIRCNCSEQPCSCCNVA